MFQISTSTSMVIDGVIEPAFKEFNTKFSKLDEKQRDIVLVRCALRSLLNPNLNSDRDLSGDLLLPVCKLLIQSVVLATDQKPFAASIVRDTGQRRPRNSDVLLDSSGAYLCAKVLSPETTAAQSEVIEKITVDFATAARTRQGFTSLSPISLENDAYRIVVREFASEALRDCVNAGRAVFEEPLWTTSDKWRNEMEYQPAFKGFFYDDSFTFWREWYQGFFDGKPLNWELQRRVALIADDIWEAGPEAVADEIERIQVRYLADQLPLAETIDLNPDTGKFRTTPAPVENAPLMSALLTQISDNLEDAMAGHNGVTKTSSEVRKIQRVVTRYGNDPQQAELTLTSVAKGLRRQLHETGELPDSENNLALLNSVEEGVRGIRANHPEVAANREQLAQLAIQELSAEDRETLEKAAPVLSAISEGALAEDFAEDIPELINDALLPLPSGAPRLPGADASTRIFSRVSKMALLTEKLEKGVAKGAQFNDSKVGKTIQIAGSSAGLAAFLFSVVQIGLRLFGVI